MGPLDALLRRDLGLSSPRHIVVVPAGLLALLPLHAARRPVAQGGGYFLRDWIVSYAPSTGSYVESRVRVIEPERQRKTLLAVTDPTEDLGVAENPAVEFFEVEASRHLRGKAATLDAVVEVLPGAAYLSFYCHGIWSPNDPGGASLVLAPAAPGGEGGRLSVRVLQDQNLQASRLAVLAACETGLVDLRQIHEVIGLPAGFLEAGLPGVVASGWPVEARATQALVQAFFRAHLEGRHPAEALREAQLAMLGSRPVEVARSRPQGMPEAGAAQAPQNVQADRVMRIGKARGGGVEPKAGPANYALPFYWAAFSFTGC